MTNRASNAVGIDLGTTYSALAYVDEQGTPRIVPDSSGNNVTPSVVCFDELDVIVGEMALEQSRLSAEDVVQFIKVHMGEPWKKTFLDHEHTPESISAIILGHLVQECAIQIGPIERAVLTVPAYFTEKRRRATTQAGEIAGLDVIGTLNEPMAATLAYGLNRDDLEQKALVYDLGGGTFDVTIVRITPGEIEELATMGDRQLGGRDWDQCLLDLATEDFQAAHGLDLTADTQAYHDARLECERAKRRLTKTARTRLRVHAHSRDHFVDVTREQFESLSAHLLQTTKLTAEMALQDAGLGWSDIARIVLVGGSTHMPAVRRMLEDVFGRPPETAVNPVLAVALGAAIYANILDVGDSLAVIEGPKTEEEGFGDEHADVPEVAESSSPANVNADGLDDTASFRPEDQDATLTPSQPGAATAPAVPTVSFVTAHGVGVRISTAEGVKNSVLIPRNTRVPVGVTKRYVTAAGSSSGNYISVVITQGDTPEVEFAEVLGLGRIEGFPGNEPPGQPVDVTMEFDEQGRLQIGAVYTNTGDAMQMSLDVADGLCEAEVEAHREFLESTGVLKVFDPEKALQGLEDDDEEDMRLV